MKEAKPVFKKENLSYEREEKEGFFTIISKVHPEARELIINPTAKNILEFANGTRTIKEIELSLINKYPEVTEKQIRTDIFKILSSFTRLGIVEWNGDNPFLYMKEEPLSGDYFLSIAQENDLRSIANFIKFMENTSKAGEEMIFYKNPLIITGEYSELVLRQKLFAFSEEFFLLKREKELKGLLSISLPIYPKEFGATLKLMVCPCKFLKELFRYSRDYLPYLTVRDISKIEFYETNSEPANDILINFLFEEGFKKEGELKDKLGFGKNLVIYSLNYTREFIKKVNEQRKKFI